MVFYKTFVSQVKEVWDSSAIGIAMEKTAGLGADFDGDECNVMMVSDPGSVAEVRYLLASKYNAKTYSGDTNIKLVPPHDAVLAFTYCVLHPQEKFWLCRERGLFKWENLHEEAGSRNGSHYVSLRRLLRTVFPSSLSHQSARWHITADAVRFDTQTFTGVLCLNALMNLVFELYGSRVCYETFWRLSQFYRALEQQIVQSVGWNEMKLLVRITKEISAIEFDRKLRCGALKGTPGCKCGFQMSHEYIRLFFFCHNCLSFII